MTRSSALKNIFTTLIILISFFLTSCNNTSNPITEDEVRKTILNMLDSFSVESDNMENFKNFVTDDYVLYEMGPTWKAGPIKSNTIRSALFKSVF